MMHTIVITAPAQTAITLTEAKAHLRVDHTDDDTFIESCIAAACSHIDGPAGWLGRSLITQTLEAKFDEFPCEGLEIFNGPVQSITSVKYDDTEEAEQTFSSTNYRVTGPDWRKTIALKSGSSWPSVYPGSDVVRVRYVAGYGDDPEDVPAAIRHAIMLMVGDLYRFRETVSAGQMAPIEMSLTAHNLLAPHRSPFL